MQVCHWKTLRIIFHVKGINFLFFSLFPFRPSFCSSYIKGKAITLAVIHKERLGKTLAL